MTPAQGTFILLSLVALAFSPWILQKARERDREDVVATREADALPELLSPLQALARHMFAEACGWSKLDMFSYDHSPWIREPWERSAARVLDLRKTGAPTN